MPRVRIHYRRNRPDADRRIAFACASALNATVYEVQQYMLRQTSGATSSLQLRRLNHPFGRGALTPSGRLRGSHPLLPINVQTGRLQRSFVVRPYRNSFAIGARLGFTAAYARFVLRAGGTRFMRARGFLTAVKRYAKSRLKANVKSALRSAFM